jgi:hypothetical protein
MLLGQPEDVVRMDIGGTTVPPINRTRTFTPVPPTRKKGTMAIVTSSLRKSAQVRIDYVQVTLPW